MSLGERVKGHNNGNELVGGDVFGRKQSGGYGQTATASGEREGREGSPSGYEKPATG